MKLLLAVALLGAALASAGPQNSEAPTGLHTERDCRDDNRNKTHDGAHPNQKHGRCSPSVLARLRVCGGEELTDHFSPTMRLFQCRQLLSPEGVIEITYRGDSCSSV